MSDQDKWITKEAVKKLARKHVAHGMLEPLIWDIDALKPIAEVQDAVSRETVRKVIVSLTSNKLIGGIIVTIVDPVRLWEKIKKLPSVLPTESRRSEGWIRCSERLPPTSDFVLFCLNNDLRTVYAGQFEPKEGTTFDRDMWYADGAADWYPCDQVLAWYKFPMPPSGSNQEKEKEEPGGKRN